MVVASLVGRLCGAHEAVVPFEDVGCGWVSQDLRHWLLYQLLVFLLHTFSRCVVRV